MVSTSKNASKEVGWDSSVLFVAASNVVIISLRLHAFANVKAVCPLISFALRDLSQHLVSG